LSPGWLPQDPAAGGTKFAQTRHLDRWDEAGDIRFVFGYETYKSLEAGADRLPANAYRLLKRPPRYQIKTAPREKRSRVKQEIVRERQYETIQLLDEHVAEFRYQPVACQKSYRMIVLRKRVGIDKGQLRLFEEYRYFFYITNDRQMTAEEVVFCANGQSTLPAGAKRRLGNYIRISSRNVWLSPGQIASTLNARREMPRRNL
jgi:hypothetical protein